jgi:hypothetical protein
LNEKKPVSPERLPPTNLIRIFAGRHEIVRFNGSILALETERKMFANLLFVTIVIIVLWVAVVVYYLYSSGQHQELEKDIESLRTLLKENQHDEG